MPRCTRQHAADDHEWKVRRIYSARRLLKTCSPHAVGPMSGADWNKSARRVADTLAAYGVVVVAGEAPSFLKLGCGSSRTPPPRRERGELGQGRVRAARSAAWMPFPESGGGAPASTARQHRRGEGCVRRGAPATAYPGGFHHRIGGRKRRERLTRPDMARPAWPSPGGTGLAASEDWYNGDLDAAAVETTTRRPRFRRASEPPAFRLTDDDVEIVRQLARHRFLRSTHIAALVGRSLDRTNDRLSRLFHAGYIDRPRAQLDYYPDLRLGAR